MRDLLQSFLICFQIDVLCQLGYKGGSLGPQTADGRGNEVWGLSTRGVGLIDSVTSPVCHPTITFHQTSKRSLQLGSIRFETSTTMKKLTEAYNRALRDTRICMRDVTEENLDRCWDSLMALPKAMQSARRRGITQSSISPLYRQTITDGPKVVKAHCSLMGIPTAQPHEPIFARLTYGVGHRTLCQKESEEDPSLSHTWCATELFCLTPALPPIEDDPSDSEAVSQSPDMNSEAAIKRTAQGLDSFCDSEAYLFPPAQQGEDTIEIETQASLRAFTQMCSGLQDTLTSYAKRHPGCQNIALEYLSFAGDSNASFDATQIFHHHDSGITERARKAAQMMKSIAVTVGPSSDSQYEEARRRLQRARGEYHEITGR